MQTGHEGSQRRYNTAVFDKHQLSNGITVWMQKSPIIVDDGGLLTVFLPGVGSQLDPFDRQGMAHFFEHVPFRGTKEKPSADLLAKPITMLGGSITNGTNTSQLRTKYCVSSLTVEHFDLAIETLYEMTINPLITEDDVAMEIGTILKEYDRSCSDGQRMKWRVFFDAFYGSQHPLGHLPIGNREAIRAMTAEGLREFHQCYYHSGNIHILCGGAFSEIPNALDRLEHSFGALPKNEPTDFSVDWYALINSQGETTVIEPRCGRDWLILKYPVVRNEMALQPNEALASLASILAGGIDSPLMKELRMKRGLVYESGLCSTINRPDFLEFEAHIPISAENFTLAQEIFMNVLRNLDAQTIIEKFTGWQLQRRTSFEHPKAACHNAVSDIVDWGKPFSIREDEAQEDAVTLDEVFAWRDYLLTTKPHILKIKATE